MTGSGTNSKDRCLECKVACSHSRAATAGPTGAWQRRRSGLHVEPGDWRRRAASTESPSGHHRFWSGHRQFLVARVARGTDRGRRSGGCSASSLRPASNTRVRPSGCGLDRRDHRLRSRNSNYRSSGDRPRFATAPPTCVQGGAQRGALVWGDDFVLSGLADWLRDLLAVPKGPTRQGRKGATQDSEPSTRLADRYGLASDQAYVPYSHERLLDPARVQHMPPQVQFRPLGTASQSTWLGVYLLDLELPEIIVPEPFPITFGGSDLMYIELDQRKVKTATVG